MFSTGRFNRVLGWSMLIVGFGAMVFIEPWIFALQDPPRLLGSTQMQLRHAQGVLLAMALLQLVVGYVLTTKAFSLEFRFWSSLCLGLGAMAYFGGYLLLFLFSFGRLLVLIGSLLNLGTFVFAIRTEIGGIAATKLRLILLVLCLGMCLDFVSGVMGLYPDLLQLDWFGAEDEVRWRMLRLARVAGIALPVLTLLFFDLVDRTGIHGWLVEWGHRGFLVGSLTMTLTLAMASFAFLEIKYLLTIPSTAVCFGAVAACLLSWRHAGRLEQLGWLIITGSLFGGMLIGMYAFDGPFPAPPGVEHYQAMSRRLMPDAFMIAPARMKRGIAINGNAVAPSYMTSATLGSEATPPGPTTIATTAVSPSATAIGTLIRISARSRSPIAGRLMGLSDPRHGPR